MTYFPTSAGGTPQPLVDAATIAWDVQSAPNAQVTITADRALAFPTNAIDGAEYSLAVTMGGVGGWDITFDPYYRFTDETPPDFSTTTALYSALLNFRCSGDYMILTDFTPNVKLFEPPPPPASIVVQIVPIEIPLTAPAKTGTQSVSVSVRANAVVHFDGCYCAASGAAYESLGDMTLNSAGTLVTFSRNSGNTPVENIVARGVMIEYISGVIEKQEDITVSASGTSATQALAQSYTYARSCAIYRGHRYSVSNGDTGCLAGVKLNTNGTHITGFAEGSGATITISATVIQIAAAYAVSVQNIDDLISGGTNLTDTITIPSAIVVANSMLLCNGMSSNSGGQWRETATRYNISSTTGILATRANATACNRRSLLVVIEWQPGILNSAQFGTITMNGVATNTATLTPNVTTSKSIILNCGFSTSQANTSGLNCLTAVKINSTSAARGDRGDNTSNVVQSFQVPEFV